MVEVWSKCSQINLSHFKLNILRYIDKRLKILRLTGVLVLAILLKIYAFILNFLLFTAINLY